MFISLDEYLDSDAALTVFRGLADRFLRHLRGKCTNTGSWPPAYEIMTRYGELELRLGSRLVEGRLLDSERAAGILPRGLFGNGETSGIINVEVAADVIDVFAHFAVEIARLLPEESDATG